MISIAVEFKPTYMPVSTIQLKQVFSGLISNGTSTKTNNRMFSSERKSVVIHGVTHENALSEEGMIHFDFPKIEEAFDCEFIAMPNNIKSEKDFHLWLMGMKFE